MVQRFLLPSPTYHEMQVLLAIETRGFLNLPLDPRDLPMLSLEYLPVSRLIEQGVLAVEEAGGRQAVVLTPRGREHMRWLVIDYQLELMAFRGMSDDFFRERVRTLEAAGCRRVLMYGASDTGRVLLEFLRDSSISVLAILDDDTRKHGSVIGGVVVKDPIEMSKMDFDSVIVTTVAFEQTILRDLRSRIPAGKRLLGLFDHVEGAAAGKEQF